MRKIEDRSAHLLHLSVTEIAQCPDVGKLNLNSIVVSAVFAALDASENARDDAALKSPATASLAAASAATDSLAAGIYASDYDIASTTYSTTPFSADGFDASSQQELDAYAASVLDEKYRQLSLGMGWIDLKNDLIPTPGTISLPPEVSNKFSEVAHLFENYPPLLMVFEEAIQELIDAAKGDERKFAIIAKRWIGDATLDDLGNQFGITRERVRQLEVELREDFNKPRDCYDAVLAKIERFIGRAIRLYVLEERFPFLMDRAQPFATTYGKLFTAIDGGWVIRNGWVFSPTFEEDIAQLLEEEKNEYGVALKHNALAKSGISERLLNEYLTRELSQKVISIKDYLIFDAGSHNSRAVALLSIHGEPQGVSLDYLLSRAGRLRVNENSIRI